MFAALQLASFHLHRQEALNRFYAMRYQPSTRRLMAPVSATRQHSQILAKPSLPSVEGGHALAFSIGAYLELLPIKTIPTPEDSSVVPHVRAGLSASLALVVLESGRMTFDFLMNLFAGYRYSAYTQTISHPHGLSRGYGFTPLSLAFMPMPKASNVNSHLKLPRHLISPISSSRGQRRLPSSPKQLCSLDPE